MELSYDPTGLFYSFDMSNVCFIATEVGPGFEGAIISFVLEATPGPPFLEFKVGGFSSQANNEIVLGGCFT